jgi:hypothetical protein
VPTLAPAPESYQLDVLDFYAGREGKLGGILCYLGAFTSLANYQNPELDFSDVVANSGQGSSAIYVEETDLLDNVGPFKGLIQAASNLNAPFILGLGEGGQDSEGSKVKNKAVSVVYFSSGDEALDYLKRVIASDHPVEVYLDRYYVYDDLAPVSSWWESARKKEHGANWFTVTGYDTEHIYLNDPTDPTEAATNLPAKVENFRLAWEKTQELQEDPPIGPFWMIYLTQIGNKKSATEVIAWNVESSGQAPSEIREFSANPNNSKLTLRSLGELAIGRLQFAEFLEKNGQDEAAALYRESGNLFATLSDGGGSMATDLNAIADKEEQALILLGG